MHKQATYHYQSNVAQDISMCRHVLFAYMLDGTCRTSLHDFHHSLAVLSGQRNVTQLILRVKRQSY